MKINFAVNDLLKAAVREGDTLTNSGALVTYTGGHTGRSPKAKYIVFDNITKDKVDWDSNSKLSTYSFSRVFDQFKFFETKNIVYLNNVGAIRDPNYTVNINVRTEYAKHSLFTKNMFCEVSHLPGVEEWDLYHYPSISSEPLVYISFTDKTILISGTLYAGEIKKSVFTVLNFLFPEEYDYLPMHCSVNTDLSGDNPTIFFGLSGTGKTTLSSESNRILLGDDEHVWTSQGLSNFEGGCYAKTVKLSEKGEPEIWRACHTKGAMLENVVVNHGVPDFDDTKHTENGRASYPTSFIKNASKDGFIYKHPKNIVMLTCDAFGVLPPVVKLTADEAVEQFLIGYTAKVAGTEEGVTEPVATCSPCFGQPFMPLPPKRYGDILKKMIGEHDVKCWLVNTGWTGGQYGVGNRISLSLTREIIQSINSGELSKNRTTKHKPTGFNIPLTKFIPDHVAFPEKGWKSRKEYNKQLKKLLLEIK